MLAQHCAQQTVLLLLMGTMAKKMNQNYPFTAKWSNCHTHLVKDGEVTGRGEDVGQDAVTEISIPNVTSRTHT